MRIRGRRRLDAVLIVGGSLVAAGVAALGAVVYDEERIDQMWVGAAFDADGTAAVHEVIDYNFGNASDRHGLLRKIPDLQPGEPFAVHSPDGAPDGVSSMAPWVDGDGRPGSEIRVGDAAITVSGRHRYVLDYRLDSLLVDGRLRWDAVGTEWDVAIESSRMELVAPFELTDVVCHVGRRGDTFDCDVDQPEPGHLTVDMGSLEAGQGFTISATRGPDLAASPALPTPTEAPGDGGAGIAQPAAMAAVGTLAGGLVTSRAIRRAGRERIGSGAAAGSAADVAYAATAGSEQLVDATELASLATTEFAPPEELTAAQGGVVHAESVQDHHKVAWLIEAAISGAIELEEEDGKVKRIVRLGAGEPDEQPILDAMFGGKDTITLGKYDPTFAAGWTKLDRSLSSWSKRSELWDPAGDRRKVRVRVAGTILGTLALVVTGGAAAMAARHDPGWLRPLAVAAVVAGVGWAALVRAWELKVRTPRGAGLWLRVESFRRFLAESEGYHAEQAAARGVLREYTAWAVAIDELDHWRKAVTSSTVIPQSAGLHYVSLAPSLGSSVSSTSTAPSSSGSGGGGGGGSGGGGGGGGGGSW